MQFGRICTELEDGLLLCPGFDVDMPSPPLKPRLTFTSNLVRSSVGLMNIPCQFGQNRSSRSRDIVVTTSDQTKERTID